jgi:ABC-type uncharacterized transport system ATPase subunit
MSIPALTMRGISKRFGSATALDHVDFSLLPGEIHALLGENGAGKSTLMNILRGLLPPTAGTITLGDRVVRFASPEDAAHAGIGMVHQHFLLVPTFTVLENLALASPTRKPPLQEAETLAARLGWTIPWHTRIADLPVGTQQRVEILKALLGKAQILLFDEPTAVLAPTEIEELFVVLRVLRAEGRSLVFVSHKLNEVMALCDRVTVLRRGRVVGTVSVEETDPKDLARRMVGEAPLPQFWGAGLGEESRDRITSSVLSAPAPQNWGGGAILTVTKLVTTRSRNAVALSEITFSLERGETLGVAGVDGNGQAELAGALTGLRPWTSGEVIVNGQPLPHLSPRDLERLGIALIPPDRHTEGLALTLSVADNLTLEAAQLPRFRRGPGRLFLDRRGLQTFAVELARDFDVRTDDLNLPARSLSGGNQQKIVIARALWRKPALLVAVSPTRGLDVAATAYVHDKLRARQADGGATVLISTELDEVIALSTRIAVLYEGRIVGIVPPNTPRETLGLMMGGKTPGGRGTNG